MRFGVLQISSGVGMELLSARLSHTPRERIHYDTKRGSRSHICDV